MKTCLSLRGVCKSYRAGVAGCSGSVAVLHDVDLDVSPGEIIAISSSAGGGKSTLLMCAAGMMRPDRGTIAWFGHAHKRDGTARPDGIAYACGRPFPYGFLTVREALEYSAVVRDLPLGQCAGRVADALERTDLAAFSDRRVDSLSGAGLARLSMATALLQQPRLLLLDDVSSGCDASTAFELIAVIRWLAAQGSGVVVAGAMTQWLQSTDLLPSDVATRFLALTNGRLEKERELRQPSVRRPTQPVHARVAEVSRHSGAPELGAS